MRGDSKVALAFIAIGFAPVLIKRSKHLSKYLGDQLVRAGEYLLHEDEPVGVAEATATEEVSPPPVVEAPVEVPVEAIVEEVVEPETPTAIETVEAPAEVSADEPTDPAEESVTDDKIEGESHKSWD